MIKLLLKTNQYLIDTYGPNSMYNITFIAHTNDEITNKSFKYVIGSKNPYNAICTLFYSECSRHLTLEDRDKNKTYKLCKYTLPACIWFLLKDRDIQSKYGIDT